MKKEVGRMISAIGTQRKKKEKEEDEKAPRVASKGIQKNLDFNFKLKSLARAAEEETLEEGVKEVLEMIKINSIKAGSSSEGKRRKMEPDFERGLWFPYGSAARGHGGTRQNRGRGAARAGEQKTTIKCFRCNGFGHHASECEQRRIQFDRSTVLPEPQGMRPLELRASTKSLGCSMNYRKRSIQKRTKAKRSAVDSSRATLVPKRALSRCIICGDVDPEIPSDADPLEYESRVTDWTRCALCKQQAHSSCVGREAMCPCSKNAQFELYPQNFEDERDSDESEALSDE
ncbi:unnamed protein product [Caenorhabditis sp. 36 PRJEB53466]|nr:unnamed protein product [Caenorhabditis sp. 36 PRJEB53466]